MATALTVPAARAKPRLPRRGPAGGGAYGGGIDGVWSDGSTGGAAPMRVGISGERTGGAVGVRERPRIGVVDAASAREPGRDGVGVRPGVEATGFSLGVPSAPSRRDSLSA